MPVLRAAFEESKVVTENGKPECAGWCRSKLYPHCIT